MALLDAYGNPVKRAELLNRQAQPGVTGIRRAFAETVATGLTPARLASILRSSDDGDIYDFVTLAEEMEERDPHYASVLGIRKRAISGLVPIIKPASETPQDSKIADAVRQHIVEHDGLSDLIEDMLDALGKGFSVTEIDWQTSSKEWVPRGFIHLDPRWITLDRVSGTQLRLRDEADQYNGIDLKPYKFIQHKARLKSGLPGRSGLARLVAFTWMCKAYATKDWMAFVETYGLPLRLGRYGPMAKPEDVEVLFRAVANIGSDAAAVLPESMRIDFQEAGTGQGNDIFEKLARWGDEQISKAVLGQTMTSDSGSSMAQAKVHNDVRLDVAKADAKSVSGSLNRDLVKPFVDLNFGAVAAYPRVIFEVEEPEDTDLILRNTFRLVAQGLRIKSSELRSKLGFSEPEDTDEVIGAAATSPSPDTAMAANRAMPPVMPPGADPDPTPDELTELEDALDEEWAEELTDLLEPIMAQLEAAEDFDSARAIIMQAFPGMRSAKMIEGLVEAAFKARVIGEQHDV